MWLSPLVEGELVLRTIVVEKRHVVYVKGVFEASEGLGAVFAVPRVLRERGRPFDGSLTIAAPISRTADVDQVLRDLKLELGDALTIEAGPAGPSEAKPRRSARRRCATS